MSDDKLFLVLAGGLILYLLYQKTAAPPDHPQPGDPNFVGPVQTWDPINPNMGPGY